MLYLNWKTWALTALLAPAATFAQVCTPQQANSSCLVIKDAQTNVELASAYGEYKKLDVDLPLPTRILVGYNHNDTLTQATLSCITSDSVYHPISLTGSINTFNTFDTTGCVAVEVGVAIYNANFSGVRLQGRVTSSAPVSTPVAPTTATPTPVATTPAPVAAPVTPPATPDPTVTYLTFDGYCDEIKFQQIQGSSTFYGTNSPSSCEAGALMFAYVLTGSDNKIHVSLSGGYADAAGNINALKAVDLELVKADQTDISGNFSAFGIARDPGNRSATQITGQLNGTWKLDTTSRGSKTFAPRSAVKPQKSIFSGF